MRRHILLAIALVLPVTAWSQSTLNFPRGFSPADLAFTGFAIVNPGPSDAQVRYSLYGSSGQVIATSTQTIPARGQFAKLGLGASELFQQAAATGWVQATSTTAGLQGFWLGGDFESYTDGAAAVEGAADLVFPLVSPQTEINVANSNATPTTLTLRLYGANGVELAPASVQSLSALGFLQSQASALFPNANMEQATHILANCTGQCSGTSVLTNFLVSPSWGVVNAVDASVPVTETSFPHVISGVGGGGNYTMVIGVTNLAATLQNVTLTFTSVSGAVQSVTRTLPGNGAIRETAQNLFGFSAGFTDGWMRVTGTGSITGFAAYGESVQGGLAIVPVQTTRFTTMLFAHLADLAPWATGLAVLNTGTTAATVEVYAMTPAGGLIGGADSGPTARFTLNANTKRAVLLGELIPQTQQRTSDGGFVFVRASAPLYGIELFFNRSLRILSNVAASPIASGITFTPPPPQPAPAPGAWTDLPLRSGAKIVYVSSSMGSDLNDGLTPETPKRTLTGTPGGFAAITNGMGDHLYLRRGDTFSEPGPLQWNKSGFSADYPAVLGAYGTGPRPIIDRGSELGMIVSSIAGPTVRYVAIVGIHFLAAQRDWRRPGFTPSPGGATGIFVASGAATTPQIVDGLLIEDCRFEFLGQGIALVGPSFDSIRNVRINRNVFVDIYIANGHTNAVFSSNVNGVIVTENVIDGVQQTAIAGGVPNVTDSSLDHSFYIQSDTREAVIEGNIIANAFDGGMMRPGGLYRNNLVIGGTIGSHHGYMFSASAPIITGGVIPWVIGNAFLRPSQFGIQMGNVSFGVVENNLILSGPVTGGLGFNLIGQTNQTIPLQVGVHNLTLRGNFILGMEGLNSAGPAISNVTVEDNQFRSPSRIINHNDYESGDFRYATNVYRSEGAANQWFRVNNTNYGFSGWAAFIGESGPATASFVDPATAPNIATYGTESEAEFLAGARRQSRQNWDDRYGARRVIQYLRQQLNLPGL